MLTGPLVSLRRDQKASETDMYDRGVIMTYISFESSFNPANFLMDSSHKLVKSCQSLREKTSDVFMHFHRFLGWDSHKELHSSEVNVSPKLLTAQKIPSSVGMRKEESSTRTQV